MRQVLGVGVLVSLLGCGDGADHNTRVVGQEVQVFGEIRQILMQGRTEPRVELASVSLTATSYGLGALSELRGEATIIGGRAWLSYPDGPDTARVETPEPPAELLALLVVADVPVWHTVAVDEDMALADLGPWIDTQARASGWDGMGTLPFLIDGPVRELMWHVIDGSRVPEGARGREAIVNNATRGTIASGDVSLIGFYDPDAAGLFIPPDSSVHVHCVDEARGVAGHVDDMIVAAGATVQLPVENAH